MVPQSEDAREVPARLRLAGDVMDEMEAVINEHPPHEAPIDRGAGVEHPIVQGLEGEDPQHCIEAEAEQGGDRHRADALADHVERMHVAGQRIEPLTALMDAMETPEQRTSGVVG